MLERQSKRHVRYGLAGFSLLVFFLGFALLSLHVEYVNTEYQRDKSRDQALAEAQRQGAIDEAEAIADESVRLAEAKAASELGIAQATCGMTLHKFYYRPNSDVIAQLNEWGFDWNAPQYNTDQWVPLFDSNQILFAAVRKHRVYSIASADLDQASICNFNNPKAY